MVFWGIEVKPGRSYDHDWNEFEGRLHITQATLGLGESKEKSIVQCTVGNKSPVFLCSLLPNKNDSCPLHLEFEPTDGLLTFTVIGKSSVHLSGYFAEDLGEECDTDGEYSGNESAETETESSECNVDDDSDIEFNEDLYMYPAPSVRSSGVVITEIEGDEKPSEGNSQSQQVQERKSNECPDNANSKKQVVVKRSSGVPVSESEDEDGFPISNKQESNSNVEKPEAAEQKGDKITEKTNKTKNKTRKDGGDDAGLERKVEDIRENGQPERKKKNKKKLKDGNVDEPKSEDEDEQRLSNKTGKDGDDDAGLKRKAEDIGEDGQPERNKKNKKKKLKVGNADEPKSQDDDEQRLSNKNDKSPITKTEEKTRKKDKKIAQQGERKTDMDQSQSVSNKKDQNKPTSEKTSGKPSKVKTLGNGLVIEDLAMGKPDGKTASPGKKVSVRYIGKLKNGTIFDSNVAGPPFKFRLGAGQVISAWDVGVNGMHVGGKRRLTVPPALGYGQKRVGQIPQNSWLVFDVELLGVQ